MLCAHSAMAEFVAEATERQLVPVPGEVHLILGGPPCQGVSERPRKS